MVSSDETGEELPRALGRYMLLKRIARGGMGEVFLASTTGIEGAERPVVVKVIRREHVTDPSFIARFLDEARVQAQLQHSGVAQVIEASIEDRSGEPYAVVEHVEGRSLGDLRARAIQVGHAFGWAESVAIATLIAEALGHVHERLDASGRALAIVHRDLSPQNVMVSYAGECKIIDFGTARGQNRRCHTVSGVVFAKPGYVAPEVANGDTGDARVDIYALGVMLWELCAGRRFLQGDAAAHMSAVARHTKDPPPIAAQIGAPAELDAIIAKLTAFDRDARYTAARTAASDLAKLLQSTAALPGGERGVRARVAALMITLFPGEPGKGRREFARLVASSRSLLDAPKSAKAAPPAPPKPAAPVPVHVAKEGDVLGGTRYKLLREIGRGSSSVVYEAEHLDLGKRAAIKILETGSAESSDVNARFRREARTLSRLSHPGLVAVHDVGQATDGRLFCVMELLDGETLEARLARGPRPTYAETLEIASELLEALEVAHGASLVHRDIKPANVFLPRSSSARVTVKLLDFGLARSTEPDARTTTPDRAPETDRAAISIFGTPEYMAPEQAGSASVDARADLYAVGCLMYELLTGVLPFTGASAVAILDAKAQGSPERPRQAAPATDIPEAVDALVMRALARHPSERFQTASEMRRAIATVSRERSRGGLRRMAAAAAAVAMMAAVALGGVARSPRIREAYARLRGVDAHAVAVTAAAPTTAGDPVAVNETKVDHEGFDDGEDGDFTDDTPAPSEAVAEAPNAAAPAAATPAPAPAEDTTSHPVASKTRRHKGKSRSAKKAEEPAPDPDVADPPAKKDRARHKRKPKAADPE